MRIGILSDTHDRVERTTLAVQILIDRGAEVLIHCGDLTGPEVVEECSALPCYYVFGNNDFDEPKLSLAMKRGAASAWVEGGSSLSAGSGSL